MTVTHKIRMDLMKPGLLPRVDVVQDDQFSRKLEISLFFNGIPWMIPNDAAALVRYCKADRRGGAYDTLPDGEQAWAISGNVLTISLTPQMMTDAGDVRMSVTLIQEERQLNTFQITLHVQPGVRATWVESENYFNVTGFLPGPLQAEAGQYLRVLSVDGNGRVTGVEAAELPACTATAVSSGVDKNLDAILNAWKGKNWYVLGDSISAEASISAGYTTKLYHRYVQEYLGFYKVVNLARSGWSIGRQSEDSDVGSVIGQLSGIGDDADLITIFAGVNDRWLNVPLGEPSDTVKTTVYGALNAICTYLLENFSDRQLLFITPTKENHAGCAASNTTGVTVEQIAEAVRDRCAAYAIDCLDAHRKSGICPAVSANAGYFTPDSLHLNENGHLRMARLLTDYLLGKGTYTYKVAAEGITLNTDSLVFASASANYQYITAAVVPENTTEVVSYQSSDTTVATVNMYGAVFPRGEGSCVITVSCGSVSAVCTVRVGKEESDTVEASAISLNKSDSELVVGNVEQLSVTVSPTGAAVNIVNWVTSSSDVLTVAGGLVTAVGAGTATVTVTTDTGLTASCSYTISEPSTAEPELTGITAAFDQGETVIYDTVALDSLKQYITVTANYTDGTAETVTAYTLSGTLTAGTSTITVTYGGMTDTVTVTVEAAVVPVSSISLGSSAVTVEEGGTAILTATVLPANATDPTITWTVASNSNVTLIPNLIDGSCTVTGKSAGTAVVTATAGEESASCIITVEAVKETFDISNYIGRTFTMTGTNWANQYHFTMVMDASEANIGDTVEVKLSVSELNNAAFGTNQSWGYNKGAGDDETLPDDTVGSAVLASIGSASESNGITVITQSAALNSNFSSDQYLIVMIKFVTTSLPASFKIENIETTYPVVNIGGYKTAETYEIS